MFHSTSYLVYDVLFYIYIMCYVYINFTVSVYELIIVNWNVGTPAQYYINFRLEETYMQMLSFYTIIIKWKSNMLCVV